MRGPGLLAFVLAIALAQPAPGGEEAARDAVEAEQIAPEDGGGLDIPQPPELSGAESADVEQSPADALDRCDPDYLRRAGPQAAEACRAAEAGLLQPETATPEPEIEIRDDGVYLRVAPPEGDPNDPDTVARRAAEGEAPASGEDALGGVLLLQQAPAPEKRDLERIGP